VADSLSTASLLLKSGFLIIDLPSFVLTGPFLKSNRISITATFKFLRHHLSENQRVKSPGGELLGHLHNHVGLTENFDQSENEEFLVNDSP
jgi:hypothetical protein